VDLGVRATAKPRAPTTELPATVTDSRCGHSPLGEGKASGIPEADEIAEDARVEPAAGPLVGTMGFVDRSEQSLGNLVPLIRFGVGPHEGTLRVESRARSVDGAEHGECAVNHGAGRRRLTVCPYADCDVARHGAHNPEEVLAAIPFGPFKAWQGKLPSWPSPVAARGPVPAQGRWPEEWSEQVPVPVPGPVPTK
jgi:hypothetical protein